VQGHGRKTSRIGAHYASIDVMLNGADGDRKLSTNGENSVMFEERCIIKQSAR